MSDIDPAIATLAVDAPSTACHAWMNRLKHRLIFGFIAAVPLAVVCRPIE